MARSDNDLVATLAHHDAAISNLGGRMSGVESSVKTLQGDMNAGFNALGSKLDRIDAAPRFDFHKTVRTVTSLATLFAIIVGGILWLVLSQVDGVKEKVAKHETALDAMIKERVGWNRVIVEEKRR